MKALTIYHLEDEGKGKTIIHGDFIKPLLRDDKVELAVLPLIKHHWSNNTRLGGTDDPNRHVT